MTCTPTCTSRTPSFAPRTQTGPCPGGNRRKSSRRPLSHDRRPGWRSWRRSRFLGALFFARPAMPCCAVTPPWWCEHRDRSFSRRWSSRSPMWSTSVARRGQRFPLGSFQRQRQPSRSRTSLRILCQLPGRWSRRSLVSQLLTEPPHLLHHRQADCQDLSDDGGLRQAGRARESLDPRPGGLVGQHLEWGLVISLLEGHESMIRDDDLHRSDPGHTLGA